MNCINILHLCTKSGAMARHARMLAAVSVLGTALLGGPAHGAPQGELDGSFGDNGRLLLRIAGGGWGDALAQQPADSKLLVVTGPAVTRLNTDGSFDKSFGAGGTVNIAAGRPGASAGDVVVQPDGKIVVAGHAAQADQAKGCAWECSDYLLVRLNPDGTPDSGFGDQGYVWFDQEGVWEAFSRLALLSDGRIIAAGTSDRSAVFARFTADGGLDPTFGNGPLPGLVRTSIGSYNPLVGMSLLENGDMIACGDGNLFVETGMGLWPTGTAVARIKSDGSLDPSFGSQGVVQISSGTFRDFPTTCVGMPDGAIVVAGHDGPDSMILRLAADGSLDTTFGSGGISRIDIGADLRGAVQSIIRLADGYLGAFGQIRTANGDVVAGFFARVDPDSGLLDPAFGNHGVTIVDFGSARSASLFYAGGLIQQVDGMLVGVGTQYSQAGWSEIALARVDPSGTGHVGFAGFAVTFVQAPQGATELAVEVRRTGGSTGTLSVDFNVFADTTQAADVALGSGTLVWMHGDMDPQFITLSLENAPSRLLSVVLSNSSGGLAASEFLAQTASPVSPPGAGAGGGGSNRGGGGTTGLELLVLLAGLMALGRRRSHTR